MKRLGLPSLTQLTQAGLLLGVSVGCVSYGPLPNNHGPSSGPRERPNEPAIAQQQQSAPPEQTRPRSSSLSLVGRTTASQLNATLDQLAPSTPRRTDHEIFARYSASGRGTWANNWTRSLDFSGVAWNTPYAGTLITPQHVVFARHYPIPNGTVLRFTDRYGNPVARRLVQQDFAWFDTMKVRTDISVGLLEAPVPESVAVYPLFPGNLEPNALLGAKVLVTTRDRRVFLSQISKFDLFNHDTEVVTTKHAARGWPPYRIAKGDSGNPMFVVYRRQLVLLSTHSFSGVAGKGPYYGGSGNQRKIQRLMSRLGGGRSSRYD